MFGFGKKASEELGDVFRFGGGSMSEREFLEKEIERWKLSSERQMMITGQLYYEGKQDILLRKRTAIGQGGQQEEIENLPNNRVVDNQYAKLVNQKADYLLGQPFVVRGDNAEHIRMLKKVFNRSFMKILKNVGKGVLNWGIAWIYPYLDFDEGICFKVIPGYEVLPFWKDSGHTRLDKAVRVYRVCGYEGKRPVVIEKAEVYTADGVERFILENGKLIPDTVGGQRFSFFGGENGGENKEDRRKRYGEEYKADILNGNREGSKENRWEGDMGRISKAGVERNFDGYGLGYERIPLIPVKYNESEIPLIKRVKSLQDGINALMSDFQNNMQEDPRNTILILKNYDGTNLGEFRKNLALYGAVKVRCDSEAQGGVESLEVKVNAENYSTILNLYKQALIENGMGYNSMAFRDSGNAFSNPNQLNIKSMYTDIDLDANEMEMELQWAFEELMYFVNGYFSFLGLGDFSGEEVEFIFNRDMLINESEAIDNCIKSLDLLSEETVVAQHPWVNEPVKEMERRGKKKADGYDKKSEEL